MGCMQITFIFLVCGIVISLFHCLLIQSQSSRSITRLNCIRCMILIQPPVLHEMCIHKTNIPCCLAVCCCIVCWEGSTGSATFEVQQLAIIHACIQAHVHIIRHACIRWYAYYCIIIMWLWPSFILALFKYCATLWRISSCSCVWGRAAANASSAERIIQNLILQQKVWSCSMLQAVIQVLKSLLLDQLVHHSLGPQ